MQAAVEPTLEGAAAEADLIVFRSSPIHGKGGFARQNLRQGARVIEYIGERIGKAESLRRCEQNNQFIFCLNESQDLDGNVSWNSARFINHSCAPNCEATLEEDRIWLLALRDLEPAEEITFNYGFDLEDYKAYPCHCGSSKCVGYIVAEEFFPHLRRMAEP